MSTGRVRNAGCVRARLRHRNPVTTNPNPPARRTTASPMPRIAGSGTRPPRIRAASDKDRPRLRTIEPFVAGHHRLRGRPADRRRQHRGSCPKRPNGIQSNTYCATSLQEAACAGRGGRNEAAGGASGRPTAVWQMNDCDGLLLQSARGTPSGAPSAIRPTPDDRGGTSMGRTVGNGAYHDRNGWSLGGEGDIHIAGLQPSFSPTVTAKPTADVRDLPSPQTRPHTPPHHHLERCAAELMGDHYGGRYHERPEDILEVLRLAGSTNAVQLPTRNPVAMVSTWDSGGAVDLGHPYRAAPLVLRRHECTHAPCPLPVPEPRRRARGRRLGIDEPRWRPISAARTAAP